MAYLDGLPRWLAYLLLSSRWVTTRVEDWSIHFLEILVSVAGLASASTLARLGHRIGFREGGGCVGVVVPARIGVLGECTGSVALREVIDSPSSHTLLLGGRNSKRRRGRHGQQTNALNHAISFLRHIST